MGKKFGTRLFLFLLFLFGLFYQYHLIFYKSYPQVFKKSCSETKYLKPFPLVYPIPLVRTQWLPSSDLVQLELMVANPRGSNSKLFIEILDVSDPRNHKFLRRSKLDLKWVREREFHTIQFKPPLEISGRKVSLLITTDEHNPDRAPEIFLSPDECDPKLSPKDIEQLARSPVVRFYASRYVSDVMFHAMDDSGTVLIPFVRWYLIGVNLLFLAFLIALDRCLLGQTRSYRPVMIILGILFLVKSLAVIRLTPPWIRIDEPIHFEYSYYISQGLSPGEIASSIHESIVYWHFQNRFFDSLIKHNFFQIQGTIPPENSDSVNTDGLSNGNYYSRFSLAHYATGKFLSSFGHPELISSLLQARHFSLFSYLLLMPVFFLILYRLFPGDQRSQLVGLAFLTYLPSLGQSLSGYSNDGVMLVLSFLYFWVGWRLLSKKTTHYGVWLTASFFLVGIGVFIDEVGYVLFLVQWILVNFFLYTRQLDRRWYIGINLVTAILLAIILWVSPFLADTLMDHGRFLWTHWQDYSIKQVPIFIAYILMSSLGVFVWGHLFYPNWVYHLYCLFLVVAGVGAAVKCFRIDREPFRKPHNLFAILFVGCFVGAMLFRYFSTTFLPYLWIHAHARFLFPTFSILIPLVVYGLSFAVKRDRIFCFLLFALQLLDWYTVYGILIPAYYISPGNI